MSKKRAWPGLAAMAATSTTQEHGFKLLMKVTLRSTRPNFATIFEPQNPPIGEVYEKKTSLIY